MDHLFVLSTVSEKAVAASLASLLTALLGLVLKVIELRQKRA